MTTRKPTHRERQNLTEIMNARFALQGVTLHTDARTSLGKRIKEAFQQVRNLENDYWNDIYGVQP